MPAPDSGLALWWPIWMAAAPLAFSQAGLPQEIARAEDVTDSGLAFTELVASRDTYLLGEPFALRLRFGVEREALRTRLVPLFQRPLDVPVQVFAPALERLEGVRFLAPSTPETGASFVLDETIARATPTADEQRAGRTYAVFEYARDAVAIRTGEIVLDAPLLGFAHATRFRDDFVTGSVPLDRADVLVRGRALRLTILPLPEEGRPADFSGAIGRFAIRAQAEPRELEQGQSLKLSLAITGDGDLSSCAPPDLSGLEGFHLQGQLVERGAAELTVLYDLAPEAGVASVPPIRFTCFDTTPPAGYRTIETPPIPLTVHGPASRPPASPASGTSSPRGRVSPYAIAGLLLAALALCLVIARRRKPA